jgi:hypothetical protein
VIPPLSLLLLFLLLALEHVARLFVGRLEVISNCLAAWSKEQLEMRAEGEEASLEFLQKMVNLVG